MRVISVLNLKGGVAKTFTAANVAYELYRRGYRVLLIDNDKQGNLSKAYSRYDAENIAPVTKLLAGDWCNVDELIQHTDYEGIDIVTANMSLFGATWNLTKEDSENQIERYKTLVYAKVQYYGDCTVYGKYDYCIIDNPPDIGLNVVNALAITDEVIVPVKVDEDALEGLDIVTEQIEDAKAFNPALKLAGVLITSYQNTDGEAAGVIMQYDHEGRVFARESNNTLILIPDHKGLLIAADLSKTDLARGLYQDIEAGMITKMSWAFTVSEESYDRATRTRTILKIKKVYDVSAVSIPANGDTEIAARNFASRSYEAEKQERLKRRIAILKMQASI